MPAWRLLEAVWVSTKREAAGLKRELLRKLIPHRARYVQKFPKGRSKMRDGVVLEYELKWRQRTCPKNKDEIALRRARNLIARLSSKSGWKICELSYMIVRDVL